MPTSSFFDRIIFIKKLRMGYSVDDWTSPPLRMYRINETPTGQSTTRDDRREYNWISRLLPSRYKSFGRQFPSLIISFCTIISFANKWDEEIRQRVDKKKFVHFTWVIMFWYKLVWHIHAIIFCYFVDDRFEGFFLFKMQKTWPKLWKESWREKIGHNIMIAGSFIVELKRWCQCSFLPLGLKQVQLIELTWRQDFRFDPFRVSSHSTVHTWLAFFRAADTCQYKQNKTILGSIKSTIESIWIFF